MERLDVYLLGARALDDQQHNTQDRSLGEDDIVCFQQTYGRMA